MNIKKGKLLVLCKEKLKGTLGYIVFIFLFFIHTSLTFKSLDLSVQYLYI